MTKYLVFLAMLMLLLAGSAMAGDAGHTPSLFERILGEIWAWLDGLGIAVTPTGLGIGVAPGG